MTVATLPSTMKAVRIKAPYKVACEIVPVPQLDEDDQVLVKVQLSGLCGKWIPNPDVSARSLMARFRSSLLQRTRQDASRIYFGS